MISDLFCQIISWTKLSRCAAGMKASNTISYPKHIHKTMQLVIYNTLSPFIVVKICSWLLHLGKFLEAHRHLSNIVCFDDNKNTLGFCVQILVTFSVSHTLSFKPIFFLRKPIYLRGVTFHYICLRKSCWNLVKFHRLDGI